MTGSTVDKSVELGRGTLRCDPDTHRGEFYDWPTVIESFWYAALTRGDRRPAIMPR